MHLTKKQIRLFALAITLVAASATGAYATFTSNAAQITNNRLTTGSANVKLCDSKGQNAWQNSITPEVNLTSMLPNEERNLMGDRAVYFGNDNGFLETSLENETCPIYNDIAGSSNTPVVLMPNAIFAAESCPDTLPSNIRLRFEIDGIDSGYKTLNAWSSNTARYGAAILPGQASTVKVFAQLSSTTTAQNATCDFTVNLTGKQFEA